MGSQKIAIKTEKFQRILVNIAHAFSSKMEPFTNAIFYPNTPSCSSIKELLNVYIIAVNGQSQLELWAVKDSYQNRKFQRILVNIAHAFSSKMEPSPM